MPRLARLDAPGVLHHVIIRGIERRKIFKDNEDPISKSWYDISVFTLFNFPEGALFIRVNPLRTKIVSDISELNSTAGLRDFWHRTG